MIFLFLVKFTTSICHTTIPIIDNLHTYRHTLIKDQNTCINITQPNFHFFIINSSRSNYSVSFYNYTTNAQEVYTFDVSQLEVPVFHSLNKNLDISITTNSTSEELTFIGVNFPTPCYNGFFYSSKANNSIFFNKDFTDQYQLKNYDDKCVLLYGYNDSTFNISYSIEKADTFKIIAEDNEERVFTGTSELSYQSKTIGLIFQSDFSYPSDYINITTTSFMEETSHAYSGVFIIDKSKLDPYVVPTKFDNNKRIGTATIIAIATICVIVVIAVIVLLIYCLRTPKSKLSNEDDLECPINDDSI